MLSINMEAGKEDVADMMVNLSNLATELEETYVDAIDMLGPDVIKMRQELPNFANATHTAGLLPAEVDIYKARLELRARMFENRLYNLMEDSVYAERLRNIVERLLDEEVCDLSVQQTPTEQEEIENLAERAQAYAASDFEDIQALWEMIRKEAARGRHIYEYNRRRAALLKAHDSDGMIEGANGCDTSCNAHEIYGIIRASIDLYVGEWIDDYPAFLMPTVDECTKTSTTGVWPPTLDSIRSNLKSAQCPYKCAERIEMDIRHIIDMQPVGRFREDAGKMLQDFLPIRAGLGPQPRVDCKTLKSCCNINEDGVGD